MHYDAYIALTLLPSRAPDQRKPTVSQTPRVDYQTDPSRYKHWKLEFEGPVATLGADFDENGGIAPATSSS